MTEDFPTREQEAVIARLAIEHGGVRIAPRTPDSTAVHLSFPHKGTEPDVWLDENGRDVSVEHYRDPNVSIDLPLDLVVDLIGRERYDEALSSIKRGTTYESISLGSELRGELVERIREYVAGVEAGA